jgi:hypothetical protein|tara:strand:+ start:186 stop:302 length:117 start_codon:yes stop_codon:yes gene_type:complete
MAANLTAVAKDNGVVFIPFRLEADCAAIVVVGLLVDHG